MTTLQRIPGKTIAVTVTACNGGLVRMVRVSGPAGEVGMVPHDRYDHAKIIDWACGELRTELAAALRELDREADELLRAVEEEGVR